MSAAAASAASGDDLAAWLSGIGIDDARTCAAKLRATGFDSTKKLKIATIEDLERCGLNLYERRCVHTFGGATRGPINPLLLQIAVDGFNHALRCSVDACDDLGCSKHKADMKHYKTCKLSRAACETCARHQNVLYPHALQCRDAQCPAQGCDAFKVKIAVERSSSIARMQTAKRGKVE